MYVLRPTPAPEPVTWADRVFAAKAVGRGGIVRRSRRDVDREIGREIFVQEVRRRGFHLIECGDQYIVICNTGQMQVICRPRLVPETFRRKILG